MRGTLLRLDGELFSQNWWHPLLRLGAVWLWLLAVVSAAVAGLVWFVGWFSRMQSRRGT